MTLRITLTKKRMLIALPFVLLALAGTAYAAWQIYTGLTGTATGNIATAPTMAAFAFSNDTVDGANVAVVPCTSGTGGSCTGGTVGQIHYLITNNDPATAHTWTTPGVTFATSDDATDNCKSHLFVASTNTYPSASVPGGGSTAGILKVAADPTTPGGCSAATITVTFTGTTTP